MNTETSNNDFNHVCLKGNAKITFVTGAFGVDEFPSKKNFLTQMQYIFPGS